ncbi:MAG: FmdB family zinc ribbon protein [Desulfitobacteriaceae bacterium]
MPSYDLVCQECGHKFSVFCSISKKEQQLCAQCGSGKILQRFTTVNIVRSMSDRSPCDSGCCNPGSCNPGSCNFSDFD